MVIIIKLKIMKTILLLCTILISSMGFAQIKVTINVASFSFSPSSQTITVGDTVEFVNTSGTHWVDGTQGTFPSNPVSFDNQSQSGTGWTYTQVFNTAGNYDYRCGIHTGMTGTIQVSSTASVKEALKKKEVGFYPNPASKDLFFYDYKKIVNIVFYSLTGEKVLESQLVKGKLNISSLNSGAYFVKIISETEEVTKKLIIK